jgi:hypothetical protein
VGDEAALVLKTVKLNGRPAQVFAFADRLLLVDPDGSHRVAMSDVARITHKSGFRRGRLTITTTACEHFEVRNLRARDTPTAYQILVSLASAAQS